MASIFFHIKMCIRDRIKYTIGPDEAFNKEVVWKSTVPDVATVDAEGRITAVKAGTTVISAYGIFYQSISAYQQRQFGSHLKVDFLNEHSLF